MTGNDRDLAQRLIDCAKDGIGLLADVVDQARARELDDVTILASLLAAMLKQGPSLMTSDASLALATIKIADQRAEIIRLTAQLDGARAELREVRRG